MCAGSQSPDHSGTAVTVFFSFRSPCFQFYVCHYSRLLSPNYFYLYLLSLLLPSPSLHPSTARALKNHKASFILKHHIPLSAERGHHYYCMSSFSVPLFSSVHPLLPGATVIMAAGDSGQTGWLLQPPCQPWVAAPSWGFAWVSCVHSRHVSSASWLFVSTLSRAITGLFGMLKSVCISLFQPASGSVSLPGCCCCCCCRCCCFDAVLQPALFLNSLITAPDRGIHLQRHMLVDTCYLSLIVVFHCDIFGTKSLKSQGWCTHTRSHTCCTHTFPNSVPNILPVLVVPQPLWARYLWCSIPTIPPTPKGLFLSLVGPFSLLYKETLEQFFCRLLNF